MCKTKVICVTNRRLVRGNFLNQIEKVLASKPAALILREKDLAEEEYESLAVRVLKLCQSAGVPCYFNSQPNLAQRLGADGVHLSMKQAEALDDEMRSAFPSMGISVHSEEEAGRAEALGAAYIIYGHIFDTDCKPGLPPRGIDSLRSICQKVTIPVFAIGGIDEDNAALCLEAGAAGVCMMSKLMKA